MPLKELKALIKLLRASGIVSYKNQGLELLLDPAFNQEPLKPVKHVPGQMAAELKTASPGFLGMTDEQIAMWSAPDLPKES